MAEETSKDRPLVWMAVAAMFSLLLLALAALGIAFFMGRSQPLISITNDSNNTQALPTPAPTPFGRPADPGKTTASTPVVGARNTREGSIVRADTQSPPYYTTLTRSSRVQFRMIPGGPSNPKGPVPFRVQQYQAMAQGGIFASRPEAGQEEAYSYLPEIHFSPSASSSQALSVEVANPRKSSVVNDLRAPKGFQFLVAELNVTNLSSDAVDLDPDTFEVRDTEEVRYLANPELLSSSFPVQPMAAGARASFQIAFLVPADAGLASLVTMEPGGGALVLPLRPL